VTAPAGIIRTLTGSPLIVDGRLRVFAARHEVTADGPVDGPRAEPPYWSLRRNRAELVAVVIADVRVVSLWSDGELVALDASTGAIAWRAKTAPAEGGYPGRRTGAAAVYPVERLHTAVIAGGRRVVVRLIDGQAWGFAADNGVQLWHTVFDGRLPNCRLPGFTTASGRYVTVNYCGNRRGLELWDASTGTLASTWQAPFEAYEIAPFASGCRVAQSECRVAVFHTDQAVRAWTFGEDSLAEALGVASIEARIAGEVAVDAATPNKTFWSGEFVGRDVLTGRELWRWAAPGGQARLAAAEPTRIHFITAEKELITVDASTGATRSRFSLLAAGDSARWTVGHVYAEGGFVFVERLGETPDPIADDNDLYYSRDPVVLAST
jgi:outer membrane protein assembly factor BamB